MLNWLARTRARHS